MLSQNHSKQLKVHSIEVTGWNNGTKSLSGAGYGFKVSITDRDNYFKREWNTVLLELPDSPEMVECNINKDSFWNSTCHELINKKIGQWLIKKRYSDWPDGNPPKFEMVQIEDNKFKIL